jgi:hypothetical protein
MDMHRRADMRRMNHVHDGILSARLNGAQRNCHLRPAKVERLGFHDFETRPGELSRAGEDFCRKGFIFDYETLMKR